MEYVLNFILLPTKGLQAVLAPLKFLALHVHDHFIPHHRNNYQPHILGHRSLALMSALLVSVKIFTLSVISFGPIVPAFSSAITEGNIISLTNQSRESYGLGDLKYSPVLDKAAQAKADDMLAKGYFSHTTPDGHTPWDFITGAGYTYLMAGENLAVNFTEAENVESAWMNSPGHKANIVNKNFEEIGIGIAQGQYQDHTAIFVVQMFGTPVEQKVTLNQQPTPVQTAQVPPPAVVPVNVAAAQESKPNEKVASFKTSSPQNQPKSVPTANPPQTFPLAVAPPPEKINIQQGDIKLVGPNAEIIAQVTGPAVKVLAYFGPEAIMLSPKSQYVWTGKVQTASLAKNNITVRLKAFAMDGKSVQLKLAEFSLGVPNIVDVPNSTPVHYSIFGKTFDPKVFENRFYLLFIAGLLSCLILAIAVKKHIQHLPLIANSSFVVIVAALLFWTG